MTKTAAAQLDREIAETYVGKFVRAKIPHIDDKGTLSQQTITGRVERVTPSGELQILADRSCYFVWPADVVPTLPSARVVRGLR